MEAMLIKVDSFWAQYVLGEHNVSNTLDGVKTKITTKPSPRRRLEDGDYS